MAAKEKKLEIHIDRDHFSVTESSMSGNQLRALPEPDIGLDRDLFLKVPGGEDQPVASDRQVELKNGMHFFTAPATITPGGHAPSGR